MKKIILLSFILSLILFTALIKNSTKNIEDEILTLKESLSDLKNELGDTKLEYEYLSSAEKLLEYQSMYFDQYLIQKDINLIELLQKTDKGIQLKNFNFTSNNE